MFKVLLRSISFLVPPHILVSDPEVTPSFILLPCGQNVTVRTLMGVGTIMFSCSVDGTTLIDTGISKDNVLLSRSFNFSISPASDDDFGTYTFYVSNKCGNVIATSTIILQG